MYCVSVKQDIKKNQPIQFEKVIDNELGILSSILPTTVITISSYGIYEVTCTTSGKGEIKLTVGGEQISNRGSCVIGVISVDETGPKTLQCIYVSPATIMEHYSCMLKIVKISKNG